MREDEVVVESVVFFFLDPLPFPLPLPPRLLNHVLGLTKGAIFLFEDVWTVASSRTALLLCEGEMVGRIDGEWCFLGGE